MPNKQVDVLAFGPHPDDVEMCCGGTLVKLKKMGYSVGLVDMTAGELGTRGTREIRAAEAKKAADILGAEFRDNLDLGDGRLMNTETNRLAVIKSIRESKPRMILICHWLDDHPDHVQGANIVKDAFYVSGFKHILPEMDFYRPKGIMYYMGREEFQPTMIIDITDEFDQKMEAINAFASQFYKEGSNEPETPVSRPDFKDIFHTRANYFGRMIGCKYGEPFYTKYPPLVDDPVSIWK